MMKRVAGIEATVELKPETHQLVRLREDRHVTEYKVTPFLQRSHRGLNRPREVQVITIEICDDISPGHAEALIDGVVHAGVGLADPSDGIPSGSGKALDYLDSAVG